ncbi:acyl--CoA ligase [Yoonia sp.]|nr:acyl--CoA ligase [Yoonia sp.]
MSEFRSGDVGHAFQRIARDYQNFPALVSPQMHLTYVELLSVAVSFAHRMRELGVTRKSVVAINTGDTVASVAMLLATSFLGCQFVVASMVIARQKVVTPTHFFKTPEAAGKKGVPFVAIDMSWMPQTPCDISTALDDFEGYENEGDPWMYLHTSGTTGNPKMLALSHGAVFRRTMAVSGDFPTAQTTMASLFGNTSRPFYARALGCLLHAGTIVDSYDVGFWKTAGVNVVFGSPRQLERFFAESPLPSKIARLEVSGAKMTDDLAIKLSAMFHQVTDVYGASETSKSFSNIIECTPDGAVKRTGKPLDSVIEIRDDSGAICPPGVPGGVRVRNDYMTSGYLAAPQATAKSFRDGWFHPGDVAQWGPQGELEVIGRNDDVLSFGGLKLDAALVDLIITVTPGVKDAICFKNPKEGANNEILAFVVFEDVTNRALCVSNIRENYQNKLNLPCFLGNIHAVDAVPRNDEGKPMRALCQQMVLDRVEELQSVFAP